MDIGHLKQHRVPESEGDYSAGTSLEPGDFYLIGESDVPSEFADLTLDSNLSFSNASTGVDGIRLINCLGAIEDTLLQGDLMAIP